LYLGIFTISLATMVFELALVKLFSVILFSNYAFMIISTALFGFGLSGVFSTIFPKLREKYLCTNGLVLFSFLFSVSALSAFFVINTVPLHLGEINRPVQMMYLALYYLSLMVPFFFSGMAIVTVFSLHAKKIGTLYFFDLTGAALACLLITKDVFPPLKLGARRCLTDSPKRAGPNAAIAPRSRSPLVSRPTSKSPASSRSPARPTAVVVNAPPFSRASVVATTKCCPIDWPTVMPYWLTARVLTSASGPPEIPARGATSVARTL